MRSDQFADVSFLHAFSVDFPFPWFVATVFFPLFFCLNLLFNSLGFSHGFLSILTRAKSTLVSIVFDGVYTFLPQLSMLSCFGCWSRSVSMRGCLSW